MIRTFIALSLPEEVKAALQSATTDLKKRGMDARWVRPQAMHLTLKFIGEMDEALVPELGAGLERVAGRHEPLALRLNGMGAFPNLRRARVIWAGLAGDLEPLAGLAAEIDDVCAGVGIDVEKRPFKPHLTVGRLKRPSMIDLKIDLVETAFTVEKISLFRSELTPHGALYTNLHTSSLRGG